MDEKLRAMCNMLQKDLDELKEILSLVSERNRNTLWMNSYQVEKFLNISRFTLRRYRELEMLRYISIRGRYRYLSYDVKKLLNKG